MPKSPNSPPPDEAPPGAGFQPAERLVISTPEQMKAVSDSLRMRMIELILTEALTVKQMAGRLDQPPTKLYYHIAELEQAGFVALVDTRVKSGIIEKYYRASAECISVDPKLLSAAQGQDNPLSSLLTVVFDTTTQDIMHSMAAGLISLEGAASGIADNFFLAHSLFHLRKEDVPRFVEKLNALLKEMGDEEKNAGSDTSEYACTLAFYPRVDFNKKHPS